MSITDELRRMLDERGIEHRDEEQFYAHTTSWEFMGKEVMYAERADNRLILNLPFFVEGVTPEQAIAATVGAGTCHITVEDNLDETEGLGDVWLECDECHWQMMLEPSTPRFKFCPNCGRRIEGE